MGPREALFVKLLWPLVILLTTQVRHRRAVADAICSPPQFFDSSDLHLDLLIPKLLTAIYSQAVYLLTFLKCIFSPVRISQRCLVLVKLDWWDYHVLKKVWCCVKLFRYNTGMWQTDRRTDRIAISISRVSIALLTQNPSRKQMAAIVFKLSGGQTFCLMNMHVFMIIVRQSSQIWNWL